MDALPCLHKVYTAPGYTYAYWDSNNPAQFKVLDLNETNAAAYTISQVPIHLYTNNERILIACQMYTGSRGTYTQAEFPWLSCFLQIISSKNKEINYVMYNDQTYDTGTCDLLLCSRMM